MKRVKIEQDDDPESPREWDNAGLMLCWHRRYTIGDKHDYKTPRDAMLSLVTEITPIDDHTEYEDSTEGAEQLAKKFEELYFSLPCYLYDHSGITMSTGSYGDRWDSGQVGFICISKKRAKDEWPDDTEKMAIQCLKSEVETYDQYLTGEVYGYIIERCELPWENPGWENIDNPEWTDEDSCWGFFGINPDENGMLDGIEKMLHPAVREASKNIGEWAYITPEEIPCEPTTN